MLSDFSCQVLNIYKQNLRYFYNIHNILPYYGLGKVDLYHIDDLNQWDHSFILSNNGLVNFENLLNDYNYCPWDSICEWNNYSWQWTLKGQKIPTKVLNKCVFYVEVDDDDLFFNFITSRITLGNVNCHIQWPLNFHLSNFNDSFPYNNFLSLLMNNGKYKYFFTINIPMDKVFNSNVIFNIIPRQREFSYNNVSIIPNVIPLVGHAPMITNSFNIERGMFPINLNNLIYNNHLHSIIKIKIYDPSNQYITLDSHLWEWTISNEIILCPSIQDKYHKSHGIIYYYGSIANISLENNTLLGKHGIIKNIEWFSSNKLTINTFYIQRILRIFHMYLEELNETKPEVVIDLINILLEFININYQNNRIFPKISLIKYEKITKGYDNKIIHGYRYYIKKIKPLEVLLLNKINQAYEFHII